MIGLVGLVSAYCDGDEKASVIYFFYASVAARTIVGADHSLIFTLHATRTLGNLSVAACTIIQADAFLRYASIMLGR